MAGDDEKSPLHGRAPRSSERTRERARELRAGMSPPEAYLWKNLKRGAAGGFRFNRQRPLGPYIGDFYCHEARLVVEVDGQQHFEQMAYDHARDEWMRANGLFVLRLSAVFVWRSMPDALERIVRVARERVEGVR